MQGKNSKIPNSVCAVFIDGMLPFFAITFQLQSRGRNIKSAVLKNWPLHFEDQVSFMQKMNMTHPPVYDTVDNEVKYHQLPENFKPFVNMIKLDFFRITARAYM